MSLFRVQSEGEVWYVEDRDSTRHKHRRQLSTTSHRWQLHVRLHAYFPLYDAGLILTAEESINQSINQSIEVALVAELLQG